VHLVADGVVFLAEFEEFGELVLELGDPLAHRDQLPLGEGDGLARVGVGHRQFGQQGRVVVEESRVGLQELDDVGSFHGDGRVGAGRSGRVSSPLKTVTAGRSSSPGCRRRPRRS
jgi:hypothetical protein